ALVVMDGDGRIRTARDRPGLLRHRAVIGTGGRVLIDGRDWESPEVADLVRAAAGPGARLRAVPDEGRFDVLPLMVTTDGAIAAACAQTSCSAASAGSPSAAGKGVTWMSGAR